MKKELSIDQQVYVELYRQCFEAIEHLDEAQRKEAVTTFFESKSKLLLNSLNSHGVSFLRAHISSLLTLPLSIDNLQKIAFLIDELIFIRGESVALDLKIKLSRLFEQAMLSLISLSCKNMQAQNTIDFNSWYLFYKNIPDLFIIFEKYYNRFQISLKWAKDTPQSMLDFTYKAIKKDLIIHKHERLKNSVDIATFFVTLFLELGDVSNAKNAYAIFELLPNWLSMHDKAILEKKFLALNSHNDSVHYHFTIKKLNTLCEKLSKNYREIIDGKINLSQEFEKLNHDFQTNKTLSLIFLDKLTNLIYFLAHQNITDEEKKAFTLLLLSINTAFFQKSAPPPQIKIIQALLNRLSKEIMTRGKEITPCPENIPPEYSHHSILCKDFLSAWLKVARTLGPKRQEALQLFREKHAGILDNTLPPFFENIILDAAKENLSTLERELGMHIGSIAQSSYHLWFSSFHSIFLDYFKSYKTALFEDSNFITISVFSINKFIQFSKKITVLNWAELLPELPLYKSVILDFNLAAIEYYLDKNEDIIKEKQPFFTSQLNSIKSFIELLCRTGQHNDAIELKIELLRIANRFPNLNCHCHIEEINAMIQETITSDALFVNHVAKLYQALNDSDFNSIPPIELNEKCYEVNPEFAIFLSSVPGYFSTKTVSHERRDEFLTAIQRWIEVYSQGAPTIETHSLFYFLAEIKYIFETIPLEVKAILTSSPKATRITPAQQSTSLKAMIAQIKAEETRIHKIHRLEEKQSVAEQPKAEQPKPEEPIAMTAPLPDKTISAPSKPKKSSQKSKRAARKGKSDREKSSGSDEKYVPSSPRALIFNSGSPKQEKQEKIEQAVKQLNLNDTIDIPADVKSILENINKLGYQAYLVGGAVRDILRGVAPKDFDIVTDCPPEELEKSLKQTLKRTKVTDVENYKYGIYEFTIKPKGFSLEEDALTRDYDCNAFYANHLGEIKNPLNFKLNIDSSKHINLIGKNHLEKLKQDPVRILRGFDLSTKLNKPLHPSVEHAILQTTRSLPRIPFGALNHHFQKLFLNGKAVENFKLFEKFKIIPHLFDFPTDVWKDSAILKEYINSKLAMFDKAFSKGELSQANAEELMALLSLPKEIIYDALETSDEQNGENEFDFSTFHRHTLSLANDYYRYITEKYSSPNPPLLHQYHASSSSSSSSAQSAPNGSERAQTLGV